MPTHAGHKHIILVQIFETDWASEHAVLVPLGAARSALGGTALCPWCPWRYPKHARPVQIWRRTRVADIEHLWNACMTRAIRERTS